MKRNSAKVREQILRAGLKAFAERGYSGASVQDIIDATKVTKPVLYYYFESKAGLYKALLDGAMDEGYRQIQEAAARATGLEAQLVEIFTAQFEFLRKQRDLVRLAFGAAFAAPGELPRGATSMEKGQRNFDFVHALIVQAQASGGLSTDFRSLELAHGIYGALCFHLMAGAVRPEIELNRAVAVRIVSLFLQGGELKRKSKARIA
jgi:AcrR family transcriptional regulator